MDHRRGSKYGKGNAKNTDGWSSRTRYVRGKNLEEGRIVNYNEAEQ